MGIESYGILNDVHLPFEDKARYKVALKIFLKRRISRLYLNGDIAEFLAVSTHPKHPGDKIDFCAELVYLNNKFDELQQMFADIPVIYICGNHEYRFFRYVRDLAPQLWGLTDCPKLLNFEERPGWRFIDYTPGQLVRCGESNLYLRHEPLGGGQNAAKLTAEGASVDIATGHTHTFQTYAHKKIGPKIKTNIGYTLGWLGDVRRNVFDYRGPKDKWVTGCTIVEADTKTGQYSLDFICLDKLPVLHRGDMFDAK